MKTERYIFFFIIQSDRRISYKFAIKTLLTLRTHLTQ